jgi:clan AA aspartic protease (TIGR02281 family)
MGTVLVSNSYWAAGTEGSLAFVSQETYRQGVQAYRDGEYSKALTHLKAALLEDPGNANIRYYMAVCLDKLVRYQDAVLQYQYVVENAQDPQVVDFSRYRIQTLQERLAPPEQLASATVLPVQRTSPSPSPKPATVSSGPVNQVSVVPLKSSTQALLVEATLNSKGSGVFILDTGATYTSISREMAEELGLDLENAPKVRITTANGRIEVPKVTLHSVTVNGLEARDVEATVIDIRKGSSFSGLLGLSFIKKFKLTIDPGAGQLIFQQN